MTVTALDRFYKMLTTARNAADAERLLQRLTVFQGFFSRADIVAMTPDDMSGTQRTAAFATLCQWRVVRKMTRNRYQIDDSIKILFPPSRDALMCYLAHCESYLTNTDDLYLYLYWKDVTCALLWGLQHWPEKIADINAAFMKRYYFREDWLQIMSMLDDFAQSGTLSDSFPATAWHPSSMTWQDRVLEHYIALGTPLWRQTYRMYRRAEAAHLNQTLSLARQYYRQTIAFAASRDPGGSAWIQALALHNLLDVLIRQKDWPAFYARVDQMFLLVRGNSYTLHQLALIMVRVDNRAAARRYFSHALLHREVGGQSHHLNIVLYRDWGRLEVADGHFHDAAVLYRLALVEAMHHIDSYSRVHITPHVIPRIEWAWRNLHQLEQEWQNIETRRKRTQRPDKSSQA